MKPEYFISQNPSKNLQPWKKQRWYSRFTKEHLPVKKKKTQQPCHPVTHTEFPNKRNPYPFTTIPALFHFSILFLNPARARMSFPMQSSPPRRGTKNHGISQTTRRGGGDGLSLGCARAQKRGSTSAFMRELFNNARGRGERRSTGGWGETERVNQEFVPLVSPLLLTFFMNSFEFLTYRSI